MKDRKNVGHTEGSLSSTHGSDADERLSGQIDAGTGICLYVLHVIAKAPSLKNWYKRQVWSNGTQLKKIVNRSTLVIFNRKTCFYANRRLAHPVLWCGPFQTADFVTEKPDFFCVIMSIYSPSSIHG